MKEKEDLKDINEKKFHNDNNTAILKAEIIKNVFGVNNIHNISKKNFCNFIKDIFYNNNALFKQNLKINKNINTFNLIKHNSVKKYIYENEIGLILREFKSKFQNIKQYFSNSKLFN